MCARGNPRHYGGFDHSNLFQLDRFNAGIKVNGPTLSDLYFLTGLVLPRTPPYQLTMAVVREGTLYRLERHQWRAGIDRYCR